MTVLAITCDCGSVDRLVRRVFRNAGLPNWLELPVFRGSRGLKDFNYSLEDWVKELDGYKILEHRLKQGGTYAVIIGFDRNDFVWSDVKNGKIEDRLRAEKIASEFA